MNLKIEYVNIKELKVYENNAKLHPDEQIEQIKKSIEQFGMNDPIAIWKDNVIIEGHGRLIACLELGMDEVPVIRLDDLTDEQRRAYTLVHNKLTMNSGFDIDVLADELDNIMDINMEDFGFNFEVIEDVLNDVTEEPEIEFTEVLGEEHNYIVLYFDNSVDWLQALSILDIESKKNLSTRTDGKINEKMERISTGRVIKGREALEKIRKSLS